MTPEALSSIIIAVGLVSIASLVLAAMLAGPDWVTTVALGLLFSNAGVLASAQGLPGMFLVPYALLLLPAAYQVLIRRVRVVWGWPTTTMVLFGVIAILSTACSPKPEASLPTLSQWGLEGIVFFVAATNSIRSLHVLRRCAQAIVTAGALIGMLVTRQHFQGYYRQTYLGFASVSDPYNLAGGYGALDDGSDIGNYRSSGMIGEPNFFAMAMICLLPWVVYLVITSKPWWQKAGWSIAGLFILEAVVFSYSRGALVALGGVIILLAILGVVPRKMLLPVAIGAAGAVASNPILAGRLLTLVGLTQDAESSGDAAASGRFSEVMSALLVYADYPLLGVGPGQFPSYYQQYVGTLGGGVHVGGGERNAHNLVAGLAADIGTLGLIAFGLVIATILVGLARARADTGLRLPATAAMASVLLYLAASVFLHLAYARYLWLFLALAASLIAMHRARDGLDMGTRVSYPREPSSVPLPGVR